jgi:hypothetical protein
MFRRRLPLSVGAVAGFALFLWLMSPTPGITWDNFRRLRVGMSVRDVEALLREPFRMPEHTDYSFISWRGDGTYCLWDGKEVVICLVFGADRLECGWAEPTGQQDYPGRFERIRPDETFLDRIRKWPPWRRRPPGH